MVRLRARALAALRALRFGGVMARLAGEREALALRGEWWQKLGRQSLPKFC